MNNAEKSVMKAQLKAEKLELRHLKVIYQKAAEDISGKIEFHQGKIDVLLSEIDKMDDSQRSILQSQIYQRDFQKALKSQIDGFLKDLNRKQWKSIDEYLKNCYTDAFVGAAYSMHHQGIPLIMPIDQKKVVEAMRTVTPISEKLYTKLGEDTTFLKKRIANNISRGVASGLSYEEIARNIAADSNVGFNRAMRIARTEGHGVQCKASLDQMYAARAAGADVLKQWNSTLDGKTRDSHRRVDGEIRELDEKFSNGMQRPGDRAGGAAEVVNCRCQLLQRTRSMLDEDELKTLQERARFFELDKTENFEDFKKKYLKAADDAAQKMSGIDAINKSGTSSILDAYEERRLKHNLHLVPKDELNLEGIFGENFGAHYNGIETKSAKIFNDTITDLLDEYDSGLTCITVGNPRSFFGSQAFATTQHNMADVSKKIVLNPAKMKDFDAYEKRIKELSEKGYAVKIAAGKEGAYAATHEFAHTLFDMQSPLKNYVEFDTKHIKKARKEINAIYEKYMGEIAAVKRELADLSSDINSNDIEIQWSAFGKSKQLKERLDSITISQYSLQNADEFLAECFTEAKIGKKASKYSDEVMGVVDKYFKKNVDAEVTEKATRAATYTAVKTVKEAEEFIEQYVDKNTGLAAMGVSYSGISVDSANAINETLHNLYSDFELGKLGGVFVAKGNTTLGKKIGKAKAAYSPIRNTLLINNKELKTPDKVITEVAKERVLLQKYLKNKDGFAIKTEKTRRLLDASAVSGRISVPVTIEDAINHEMGHMIEKLVAKADNFDLIKANMPKYAENISGYATQDISEYIAESFASYRKGEGIIDPELEKAFDSLKRKEI